MRTSPSRKRRGAPIAATHDSSCSLSAGKATSVVDVPMGASVLGESVVGIAVEPALPGLGRGDHVMPARVRMLACVPVRGVVAAARPAAFLARPQVDPARSGLDAGLALAPLRVADFADGGDVGAGSF